LLLICAVTHAESVMMSTLASLCSTSSYPHLLKLALAAALAGDAV
jgi:hypothetical protein